MLTLMGGSSERPGVADPDALQADEDSPTQRFEPGDHDQPSFDTQVDATLSEAHEPRPRPPSSPPERIGRYTVRGLLGQGGMGEVYECYDGDLDRRVAVKLLHESRDSGRLLREARGLARLSHPNVVAVYEVGEHEGAPFLAMELVDGQTLSRWLVVHRRARPRSWEEILDVLRQAGRGLEAAHAAGLVHRDFKPDNVIVGADGRVRVLDFGLARSAAETETLDFDQTVTRPDAIVGTPRYMALEQWSGRTSTPATDQYAFCVVAHEALFGVRPFAAEHFWQLPHKISSAELEPIPRDSPVPARIYRAIVRGLAGDPAARWPSLGALLSALEAPAGLIDFSTERDRHEHFFGRDDVLASLDAPLRAWDRGWLLLTGGPGMGKSAILNHWLSLRERDKLPTAFHFIRRNHKNWADPEAIRANLAAQIEAMFPEQRDPNASAVDRLERLLGRVSPVLEREQRELVMLVDGLDEAMELGRGNPVPMIFPLELPSRVFVFAASRPRYPHLTWFHQRSAPVDRIDLDALVDSNERAVREYWRGLSAAMPAPPSKELIEAAISGARGNLQHAVKLCELWTRRTERSVDDVPEGFEGLITGLLERVGELPKRERSLIWDGLVLLCAARESMPLAVIEELLGWDEGDGTDEFLPLAREMLLEESGPGGPCYRLFHERFSERVDKARPRLLGRHHARLAEYCASSLVGDEFRHNYTLDHRVAHQIAAGDLDGAAATCMDVGFLTAKAIRRGVTEVELEIRAAATAQGNSELGKQLATLARIVGACVHWARNEPRALPALVHDKVLTHAPKLLATLSWPSELASRPRLRHPLQRPSIARVLRGQRGWVVALAVLPGGRVASASDDKIRVWDVESGRTVAHLAGHRRPVSALTVLPDGRLVSASTDDAIYIWPADPERARVSLAEIPGTVTALASLPGGRLLGGDDTSYVWDVNTGELVATLEGHEETVTALGVLADGRVVVGDHDELRVWDTRTGQLLASFASGHGAITALLALPDGRVVCGAQDGTLRMWDLDSGSSRPFIDRHASHITAFVHGPDGRVVSSSFDKTLRIWDVDQRRAVAVIENHQTAVIALAALSDGRVVSGCADNTVRVMDLDLDQSSARSSGHEDRVRALVVLPGGQRVVSASQDKTLRVWDTTSGRTVTTIQAHDQRISALAVARDGRVVSGSDDKSLRVWAVESGQLVATLRGHEHHVTVLAALADGRVVSGSQDNSLRIWDLDAGTSTHTLRGHHSLITAVTQLPDGRLVSSAQDRSLRVWDPATGRLLSVLDELSDYATALAVLPDGRLVSGGQDRLVRIWEIDAALSIDSFAGHQHAVTAVTVLPGGRIASGSRDYTIRLWDTDGSGAGGIVHADAPVFSLAAVDEQQLVAGDGLGNVWFIDVGSPQPR
jgi:WD40 repeat protein/serine/threonine protein kinase